MVAKSESKHYNTINFNTHLFFPSRNLNVPLPVFQTFCFSTKKQYYNSTMVFVLIHFFPDF